MKTEGVKKFIFTDLKGSKIKEKLRITEEQAKLIQLKNDYPVMMIYKNDNLYKTIVNPKYKI